LTLAAGAHIPLRLRRAGHRLAHLNFSLHHNALSPALALSSAEGERVSLSTCYLTFLMEAIAWAQSSLCGTIVLSSEPAARRTGSRIRKSQGMKLLVIHLKIILTNYRCMARSNNIVLAAVAGAVLAALIANYLSTEKGKRFLDSAANSLKD